MSRAFPVLLVSSLKSYYRNRQAIFFSLIFPLVIMCIFGLLNLGGSSSVNVGVVDQAQNQASAQFIAHLKTVTAVHLYQADQTSELAALNQGNRDLVAVLPANLGSGPPITAYLNQARQAQAQVARAILEQTAAGASFAVANLHPAFSVVVNQVAGKSVSYVDFLVPGVIGMSVMQTGIFSLAFALVRLKNNGALRRLLVTPMHKFDFMAAEVLTRLIMEVIQVILLLAVALVLFHFDLTGNVGYMLISAAVGGAIFIALGYVIAAASKSEDAVPAIANLVALPMMFLSGVFFPIDSVPSWLRVVSDRLPLTYLNDALRGISVDNQTFFDPRIQIDLVWMVAWLAVMAFLAVRVFRWE